MFPSSRAPLFWIPRSQPLCIKLHFFLQLFHQPCASSLTTINRCCYSVLVNAGQCPKMEVQGQGAPQNQATQRRARPPKRHKIAIACDACREKKIRCDGQKPTCGNCKRKHKAGDRCKYVSDSSRASADREHVRYLEDRIRMLESDQASPSRIAHAVRHSELAALHRADEVPSVPPISNRNLDILSAEAEAHPSDRPTSTVSPLGPFDDRLQGPDGRPFPEQDGHVACSSVSAMGAASHISDSVTAAQELFYGSSSAVSFQHQVRETLRASTGESDFVYPKLPATKQSRAAVHGLSSFLGEGLSSRLEALTLPPRALADHLLDLYWARVHCLYPFIHKPSFLESYEQIWARDSAVDDRHVSTEAVGLGGSNCGPATFSCALNAVFALSCQFSDLPSAEREALTSTFFLRGKYFLHIDILDEGDLALVQALLIMAQFLQSTHYPDRCWNMVGLAYRVAQGIGLYIDDGNENRSPIEVEMRRRAWYGCIMLDTVVSMTLGRPSITTGQSDIPLPIASNDDSLISLSASSADNVPVTSFFVQALKVNKILAEVLTDVYKPLSHLGGRNKIGQQPRFCFFDVIIDLDNNLSHFERNVPEQLYWGWRDQAHRSTEIVTRQRNVLHARFVHLKLLLYRPILNQLCVESKLGVAAKGSSDRERQHATSNMLYGHFAQRCAEACVGAAEELIDIVDHASQTAATDAWWYNVFYLFSSAMVLILAEVCPTVLASRVPSTVQKSWDQCQRALERMGLHNDAANQCAKTLYSMHQQIYPTSIHLRASPTQMTQKSDFNSTEGNISDYLQTSLYETSNGRGVVNSEFLFSDLQLQDMLSQNSGLQPPWNLDDIGWGNIFS
ncbi:hypothetical protein VE01_04454 [Pseudogymnoascus verrucosus]|uniref:Zn(2)-C6 fungal-type domain-containing protein n=1 Tax=Pseudogymnoascus verrucosus TaxID=342668 RepID=A0A1B8GP02_9PEZI|nr:uncharacterized protein VE01_04454 [Pseudogymnoascus verrucosus]OBT97544.2 hypothetical protein VE01_04454 [Pseudogymnoascus verrucosus]